MRVSPGKKARAVKSTVRRNAAREGKAVAARRKAAADKMRRRATEKQTEAILAGYAPMRQGSVYGDLRKVTLSLDQFTTEMLHKVGRGSMSEGARHLARLVNPASLEPAKSIGVPPPPPSPQVALFDNPEEAIKAGVGVLQKLVEPQAAP